MITSVLGNLPGRSFAARLLGPSYSLRCVLFHDVEVGSSPFTEGLRVRISPTQLESRLDYLRRNYTLVDLDWVIRSGDQPTPKPPLLVTFDDTYASVVRITVPILERLGIPAVFFLNAGLLDNRTLALDNTIAYVTNRLGLDAVAEEAGRRFRSMPEVLSEYVAHLALEERERFRHRLAARLGEDLATLAGRAQLYLASTDVSTLTGERLEVGNHTLNHVHCGTLARHGIESEIVSNQRELKELSGREVRAFSFPYGSRADATPEVLSALETSGHEVAFLVHALPNTPSTDRFHYFRVSLRSETDAETFVELEILPRLRAIRRRLGAR